MSSTHTETSTSTKTETIKPSVIKKAATKKATTPTTTTSNANKRNFSESSADEFNNRTCDTVEGIGRHRKMWRNDVIIKQTTSTRAQPQQLRESLCGTGVMSRYFISNFIDVVIRMLLVVIFCKLEVCLAFRRKIQPEEMWLYKNPRTTSYVSPVTLIISVIFAPFIVTIIQFLLTNNRRDFRAASWTWTLILGINGLATSLLKISVGRPRPDFYYRCFPDGIMVLSNVTNDVTNDGTMDYFNCTGNPSAINEGYKSFPSGHASFSFASFGFIAFYFAAKLHTFNHRGRGESWRLCITLAPLFISGLVAVSRTCDYHHHWQDVLAGSIIGICTSYLIYRQYYPSIFSNNCQRPLSRQLLDIKYLTGNQKRLNSYKRLSTSDYGAADVDHIATDSFESDDGVEVCDTNARNERCHLISDNKRNNKWI